MVKEKKGISVVFVRGSNLCKGMGPWKQNGLLVWQAIFVGWVLSGSNGRSYSSVGIVLWLPSKADGWRQGLGTRLLQQSRPGRLLS